MLKHARKSIANLRPVDLLPVAMLLVSLGGSAFILSADSDFEAIFITAISTIVLTVLAVFFLANRKDEEED